MTHEERTHMRDDAIRLARAWLQDAILGLDPRELEGLSASLFRAMGYPNTEISMEGPDGGVDVLASTDPLFLSPGLLRVQVKHRPKRRMSAPELRGFLTTLRRPGERGVCVSTGGFTRDARYEAERALTAVYLIDLATLIHLIMKFYDDFDSDGRTILPLQKVYFPIPQEKKM